MVLIKRKMEDRDENVDAGICAMETWGNHVVEQYLGTCGPENVGEDLK